MKVLIRCLTTPLPHTPRISPQVLAVLLAIFSLTPGLSDLVFALCLAYYLMYLIIIKASSTP